MTGSQLWTKIAQIAKRLEGMDDPTGDYIFALEKRVDKLEHTLAHESNGSTEKHAKHFRDVVRPAMEALRESVDELELMMPHGQWPLATYREMLFIK